MSGNPDDPFASSAEPQRTILRPTPGRGAVPQPPPGQRTVVPGAGGAGGAAPAAPRPAVPRGPAGPDPLAAPVDAGDLARGTANPLVAAAMPLLGLVVRMKTVASGVNIVSVRDRVYEELRAFAGAGRNAGIAQEPLRAAHLALCATVDDVVMNTPWGAHGGWAKRSMGLAFHNTVDAGELFYTYLSNMLQAPAANRLTLELMYCCLSLGFEGMYRLHARGASEHAKVRENLYNTLRGLMGPQERELSPEWRGVDMPARSAREGLPVWVFAAAAAVLLLGLFWGLSWILSSGSDGVSTRFAALLQPRPFAIAAIAPPPHPGPPTPTPPGPVIIEPTPEPGPSPAPLIARFLDPEIRQGLVSVDARGRDTIITIHDLRINVAGSGMFDTGDARLRPEFVGLMHRIGEELHAHPDLYPGRLMVDGHTDNVPIGRGNLRFPTNQALSEARAASAAGFINETLQDRSRIVTHGYADTRPAPENTNPADNNTPQGRARNRRIVVTLEAPG
jgi:type VI secretion system protein ImpK